MAKKDITSNLAVREAIAPAVVTAAAPVTSAARTDTNGFNGVMGVIVAAYGSGGDAVKYAIQVLESDVASGGTETPVDAKFLRGSLEATKAAPVAKFGYSGTKRYVSVKVTPSATSTANSLAAVFVLGAPEVAPTE